MNKENKNKQDFAASGVAGDAGKSADLLVENCLVAVCDESFTSIENASVAVKDGLICWIGPAAAKPEFQTKETVNGKGNLLAPGLVNCHCHLADSLFRGLVEDLPLEEWLGVLWKAEGAMLNPETTELGAKLGLAELLLGGTTTVLDMFWFPDSAAKAACELGARIHTGGFAFDPPGMDGFGREDRLPQARKFIGDWESEELVTPVVMAHGAYTAGPDSLREMHGLAQESGLLFHIHAAETVQENKTVLDAHGRKVIGHLGELGILGPRTLLAHAVHLDDGELNEVADSKTMVVHNPVSNLKLGSGFARIPEMLELGVRVSLGTDGAVSGNDIDMFMAIRLAAIMHRGKAEDATAVGARRAVAMATLEGAAALGAQDMIGSLEVGKRADMILVDLDVPHAQPLFNTYGHLAYSASSSDVKSVWVGGRQVVSEGELLTADLDGILESVRKLAPEIKSSIANGD